jgi:MFS family permease
MLWNEMMVAGFPQARIAVGPPTSAITEFTTASLACAAAPSSGFLISMRVVQGAFGALIIPQGFGMIKAVFPDEEVQKAFAAFGPVIGIAAVISPILGGALISGDLFGLGCAPCFSSTSRSGSSG